jgi:hypothetical protein
MIDPEFSSDIYAAKSWLDIKGINDVDGLIHISVVNCETANDDICNAIKLNREKVAMLLMSAVNFITG